MKHKNIQKRAFQTLSNLRLGRTTTLLTLGCFSLPLSSAHASGTTVLPPVVVHPVHQVSSSPTNQNGNSNSNLKQPGNSPANSGFSQTSNNNQSTSANTAGGQSGNLGSNKSAGNHSGKTTSNNPAGNQTGSSASAGKNFSSTQNVVGQSTASQTTASPAGSLPSAGYKLDLSSTTANIVLGSNLFNHSQSIAINVGGSSQNFIAGQKVTAAEYVAIQQQLSGSGQTLVLNAQGAADAGKFSLTPTLSANAGELLVPKGVTALDYLSKPGSLVLSGDLINYGSIYAVSTNQSITGGSVSAKDIINESSGIISTALPASLASSIHGENANVSLSLNALNNITNSGTISSEGGLSLTTTSGGISNNTGAVISAANNVNLNTGNGNIAGAGLVLSKNGNVNVTAPGSQDINIQAAGGTFQALQGNINVRDASYNGTSNISLSGGNYLSQNLNLYSGNGQINTNVGQVSGNLNSFAQVEHFATASPNLILGNNTITGDPTYANTAGNIVIAGSNTFFENVAILAAGNITSDTAGQIIDAGNNVTLVAGVTINLGGSGTGGNSASSVTIGTGGTATPLNGTQTATVDFSTGGGGSIDFSASTATPVIDTHGTSAGQSGGSVTLAALNTFFGGGGQVLFPLTNTSIDTHGNGTGDGGNVSIYAGANPLTAGTVIQLGAIVTGGGANGGRAGNISIFTSQPTSTSGTTVTFDAHGNVTAGAITESTISPNGQIVVGQISSYGAGGYGATAAAAGGVGGTGGTIIIHAGSNVTASDILAFGGGGGGAGGNSAFGGGNGGSGGIVAVSSDNGTITINGEVNTAGGGGGGFFLSPTTAGTGGFVLITSGGIGATIKNGIYAANGGAGGSGLSGSGGGGSYGGGGGGTGGAFAGGGGGGGAGYLGGGGGGGGDINNIGGGGQGGGFLSGVGGAAGGTASPGGNSFLSDGGTGGADGALAGGAGGTAFSGGGAGQSANSGQPGASAPIVAGPGAKIAISQGVISASGNAPLVLNVSQGLSTNGGSALYFGSSASPLHIDTTAGALQIVANGGTAGSLAGNGGETAVVNTGNIIVNTAALAVAPLGLSGNGGLIELEGNTITSSSGNALVLNASGVGSGTGGSVEVVVQSNSTQTIGAAPGNFELIANSGPTGNLGGSIQFGASGNVVVNTAQLSAAILGPVGSGGQISLVAGLNGGTGTLAINGSLDVSSKGAGQTGGEISLISNSPQPFMVGQASANGISGTVTTSTGINSQLTINNKGGGIETFVPLSGSGILITAAGNIVIGAPIIGQSSPFSSDLTITATGSITYLNPNSPQPLVGAFLSIGGPGGIGSATSPLSLNASQVSIESSGATYVVNYAENGQTLLVTNLTGPLSYSGTGNISVNQQSMSSFTATSITIASNILDAGDTAGNITLGGSAIGTGAVNITTSGANTIIEQNNSVVQGGTVTLQTGSGAIGTVGNTFLVSAPQLSVLTSGLVNINDQNAAGVTLLSAPTQSSFALTSAGPLTVTASNLNAATSITLASSNNGNINIDATVGGAATVGGVNLFAIGSGNITGTGTIAGGPMVLSSTTGGVFLNVNTLDLTVTAGPVSIADATTLGGFVLRNSSGTTFALSYGGPGPWTTNTITASGSVTLKGSGNLSLGAVSSGGNITVGDGLNGGNGNILITGALSSASAGTIGLYANGSGSITETGPNAEINSHLGTVNLASSTGSLGSTSSLLRIVADDLSAVTTGLVNIGNSSGTTLTLTNANSTSGFFLYSQGTIIVSTPGLNSASAIGLFAQANDGGITLNNPIGNANTQVSLLANGAGLISQTGNTYVAGASVNLAAGQGGIYLNINTNSITANGGGIVSLGDLSFGTATLNNSTAGNWFSLGSNGSLVLNNILASAGYVNILSAGALLQTAPGAGISANGGVLILENANTASGAINIGAGDYIHTTGTGNQFPVDIVIGAVPPTPVQGTKPANVTINNVSGGTAYFGTNSISAPTAPVTLNLAGSNIVFNTGTSPASAITVNSGVTITADPVNAGGSAGGSAGAISLPTSMPMLNQAFALPQGAAPALVARDFSTASSSSILTPATLNFGQTQNAFTGLVGQNGTQLSSGQDIVNNTSSPININVSSPQAVAIIGGLNLSSAPAVGGVQDLQLNTAVAGSTMSNIMNAAGSAAFTPIRSGGEYWMSDTELSNGRIPAILFSDEELGIKTDVSTVVELEEENTAAGNETLDNRTANNRIADYHIADDQTADNQTASVMPLTGSVMRSVQGTRVMHLKRGSVVFAPAQDTVVHTAFGDVKIDARSVVLMMSFRHGLAIYNLHDGHGKAVSVNAGEHTLDLSPGMQVVITNESAYGFEEVNPAAQFGYRNLRVRALGQRLKAFVSEFSIPQAVTTVTPLRQLVTSKHPQARKCANHLLKTAAILGQMRSGPYEQIPRPELTAYEN